MNTNALRQKILDLAIHGKLVKQDPADESATILLEKIRAEKEKKIASGELKRGKNDSYIFFGDDNRHYEKFADGRVKDIEDEIPFAVPEGWAWCRLSNISASIFAGGDRPIIYEKTKSDKCSVPIYSNGIENNGLYGFTDKSVVNVSSLTISARGTIGFSCIRNEPFVPIIRLITIIPFIECINLVFLKFSSDVLFSFSEGSSIPQLTVPTVKQFLLPLPPLAEQQRIVAKIETIFAQIDLLEQNKADLQTAVKQAKSKILDLAIRGKLVPQDPADEPVSVMLEKLHAEKEAKIAAGEIKRGKNDSYIYKNSTDNCYYEKFDGKNDICIDNEIPFELPENWQWTKLGRICDKLVDGDHNPPKGIEEKTEYIMVSSRNINRNTVENLENVRYLTKEMFEAENLRTNATAGDILFTSVGSLGRSCIYDGSMNICFQRSVSILNTKVYNKYVKFFFDSNFYQNYVAEHATGTAQMGFYLQEMAGSFIAIPPISEQKRIVAKIEEIFNTLDDIQRNLI
ncbi:restriction endonuclease subunit S [Treponema denticola]|uniref:restriction endonuclease subunit S n=1 Tax=Treponema denticola TaxID=158 RepID=UPI003D8C4AD8